MQSLPNSPQAGNSGSDARGELLVSQGEKAQEGWPEIFRELRKGRLGLKEGQGTPPSRKPAPPSIFPSFPQRQLLRVLVPVGVKGGSLQGGMGG